ncbi:elongation protein 3 homolog, putative [Trichomonas vaginalis G3]|uniref:Elongator complex protein 3 n=1 Tax=Trichomonas vaginalis (strain ATCC PRA-98 / G3) TaxID=412133 RepID=A2E0C1_TRIV3|nr:histone acetyltransferase with radical SAM domain, Elp3 type family [Trichomonas vaginalis G3]EAY13921.1 elongation protein 3 homolog, putative [Trichomonas vaginalis G3]KAI5520895.1 histone acetyltransferase with radical SAM domain, Elp3 type family [Trichomonas vaginalis G3]|eukprot:XP_001326144.1 elongation protein 3 homolog [Trichomonas vaginalis G3]
MSEDPNNLKAAAELAQYLINSYEKGYQPDLQREKFKIARKYHLSRGLGSSEIIKAIPLEYRERILPLIRKKPVRTASGVAVIAFMCKPHRCPHVETNGYPCSYCPGGPDSDFDYSSQSYTGYEPTSMRAIRSKYDPFSQIRGRIAQLNSIGHSAVKLELILMGGTFLSLEKEYRDNFIIGMYAGVTGHVAHSVKEATTYAECSTDRAVALTIETRPDYCFAEHIDDMLTYGTTRVEIGLQTVWEDVLWYVGRGHGGDDVARSFRDCRRSGLKVTAHMMPNLPHTDFERDIDGFVELFENPYWRPDGLKLYPTLVMRGTMLYDQWVDKTYVPLDPDELITLISEILRLVPPWVRVFRIQRDVPMTLVSAGVENGNLRDIAMKRLLQRGGRARDVRAREVGITEIRDKIKPDKVELVRRDFMADDGWETVLSYEDTDNDILIGLVRLRAPGDTFRDELQGASLVRELHVYGQVVPIDQKDLSRYQHKGYGAQLMAEAERITVEEHGSKRLAVISGIGVRDYYKKLGYRLEGAYMVKDFE